MCLNIGVEKLIKKLRNKDNIEVKEQAIQYLVKIGELATNQLTEALEHKNQLISVGVVEVLGKIGNDRALASLKNALKKEENGQVLDQIEKALARF